MYGEPQAFGHFGAPDILSSNYGNYGEHGDDLYTHDELIAMGDYPESTQVDVFVGPTPEQAGKTLSSDGTKVTSTYKRNGKRLPFIKGGATDASVKSATGIEGLITEIKANIVSSGVSIPTGVSISTADIKAFQKKMGLKQDGVIGKKTYEKLGFAPPFPQSSSGGSTYNPKTDAKQAVAAQPFYKKGWFQYSMIGLVVVATGVVLFYPKGDK